MILDYSYSPCLGERLNDVGQGHSPIYGFSTDGFPIYGPYQAAGELAESCWQKRVYSVGSPTGCSNSKRSCVLKNPLDYTQGTDAVFSGPGFTDDLTSDTGKTIIAAVGVYKQDFFFNAS